MAKIQMKLTRTIPSKTEEVNFGRCILTLPRKEVDVDGKDFYTKGLVNFGIEGLKNVELTDEEVDMLMVWSQGVLNRVDGFDDIEPIEKL